MNEEGQLKAEKELDGMFKGRRIFIIGNGPSLRGFDFTRLDGEITVGINNIIKYYNGITALHWLDGPMYALTKEIIDAFKGLKITSQVGKGQATEDMIEIRTASTPTRSFQEGGFYSANNSGLTGYNIAIAMGASEIYLLGMDCQFDKKGRSHFFDEPHNRDGNPGVYHKVAPLWETFPRHFGEDLPPTFIADTKSNPDMPDPPSLIKCFPFVDIDDVEGIPKKGKGKPIKKRTPKVKSKERKIDPIPDELLPDCPVCSTKGKAGAATVHISPWSTTKQVHAVYFCMNPDCQHKWTLRRPTASDYTEGPQRSVGFYNTAKKWNGDHVPMIWLEMKLDENGKIKVLDLGAGPGLFAYRVREEGLDDLFKVTSIDRYESCIDMAEKAGIKVESLDIMDDEALKALGRYDLVYSSHILEQLPDPVTVLKRLRNLLPPRGRIFIEVPDGMDVFDWELFFAEGRIQYFSRASLESALKQAGFVKVKTVKEGIKTEVTVNRNIFGGGVFRAWAERGAK